jgi:hypothetical protein
MWLVHKLLADGFPVAEQYGKRTANLGGNMLTKNAVTKREDATC